MNVVSAGKVRRGQDTTRPPFRPKSFHGVSGKIFFHEIDINSSRYLYFPAIHSSLRLALFVVLLFLRHVVFRLRRSLAVLRLVTGGELGHQRRVADKALAFGAVVLVAPVTLRLAFLRDFPATHAALALGHAVLVAPPAGVFGVGLRDRFGFARRGRRDDRLSAADEGHESGTEAER